ncbi:hypothetical protein QFC19_003997 [Naganishia cerealis]|uniref:Uncharacterized protein n=1 Tax=Naganishia cerealis TaxID=610337 RepID=A0ACC2VZP3_9TREE|nr:hypothetical protein QFC19_003997 [Naganishia cerealis]
MSFFPSSPHPLDDSHTPLPSAVGTPGTSLQPYSTSAFALPSASGLDPADIPITRSRTLYYLSVRDSTTTRARSRRYYPGATSEYGYDGGSVGDARFGGRGAEEETAGLMDAPVGREGDYTLDIQRAGLPPKWVDTMEQVDDILEKTKSKHRSAEEREIEASTVSITRDLRKMQSLIQEIRPPATGADKNEITTTRNVQRALAARIQDLSAAFRKKQKVYMQQLQGHAIKNKDLLTASGAITLKGPERFEELEEDIQASHAQLSQTQRQKTRNQGSSATETVIRQRDREITHLAHSIADLGDLFRDMANLVVEQGTVLDSVEYNVEVAAREVKGAVDELGVAQSERRRHRDYERDDHTGSGRHGAVSDKALYYPSSECAENTAAIVAKAKAEQKSEAATVTFALTGARCTEYDCGMTQELYK